MTGTYEEALAYIHGLYRFGSRLGLRRPRRLLAALGNPHLGLRVVHVAGTNGKGSVSAITASVLQAAGYRVGLYISPYIADFRERIVLDGEPIAPGEVADLVFGSLVPAAAKIADELGDDPVTEFEFVTALGLVYFARRGVDFLVFEVGLGGRFDATNVVDRPLVTVITPVGYDHMDYLGRRIGQIAAEKAGIIKRSVPVVTGPQEPEAYDVIAAAARRRGCLLYEAHGRDPAAGRGPAGRGPAGREPAGRGPTRHRPTVGWARDSGPVGSGRAFRVAGEGRVTLKEVSLDGQLIDYQGPGFGLERDIRLPLLGAHQLDNAAVALTAAAVLKERGLAPALDGAAIRKGLASTVWPGRFEVFGRRPPVVVDGAHNPPGAAALARSLRDLLDGGRLYLVLGLLRDKDVEAYLRRVLPPAVPNVAGVFTCRPDSRRAMPADELAGHVRRLCPGLPVTVAGEVGRGVRLAYAAADPSDAVCVAGSLYQVAGARAAALELTRPGRDGPTRG